MGWMGKGMSCGYGSGAVGVEEVARSGREGLGGPGARARAALPHLLRAVELVPALAGAQRGERVVHGAALAQAQLEVHDGRLHLGDRRAQRRAVADALFRGGVGVQV